MEFFHYKNLRSFFWRMKLELSAKRFLTVLDSLRAPLFTALQRSVFLDMQRYFVKHLTYCSVCFWIVLISIYTDFLLSDFSATQLYVASSVSELNPHLSSENI